MGTTPRPVSAVKVEVFKTQRYKEYYANGGAAIEGLSSLFPANLSSDSKFANGKIRTNSSYCSCASLYLSSYRIVMRNRIQLTQETLTKISEAAKPENLSDRHRSLMNLSQTMGLFIAYEKDLGVRADLCNRGVAKETTDVTKLKQKITATAAFLPVTGTMNKDFGLSMEESVKEMRAVTKAFVIGAPCTVTLGNYSELYKFAGKSCCWDTIKIHSMTSIFDLIPKNNKALYNRVWDAMKWHERWSCPSDRCFRHYWINPQPILYTGFSVWTEHGIHKVVYNHFESEDEARSYYSQSNKVKILCKWNPAKKEKNKLEFIRNSWGRPGAVKTLKTEATLQYMDQLGF